MRWLANLQLRDVSSTQEAGQMGEHLAQMEVCCALGQRAVAALGECFLGGASISI